MIRNAKELKSYIEENGKTEKFERLIFVQNKYIEDSMKCDNNSALWIFNRKDDYYHTDLERKWTEEFNNKAIRMYEKKGYKVMGNNIVW